MDFCVFFKKEQKPVSFQKNKKLEDCFLYKKNGFFSTLTVFQYFFVIFP